MTGNGAVPLISAREMRFSFPAPDARSSGGGIAVFSGISFELGRENPVVILGPSGCGKTTLLRLMAGLLPPDGPSARAGNAGALPAISPLPGSFVFQDSRLLPWLTVLENVTLPLRGKMEKPAARERALYFLERAGLADYAARLPEELSGGQKQRASIARSFAFPAPVIYMDEPFQSLDIPLRLELMALTEELVAAEKRLLVMVTHDPREAVCLARRVIVLGKNAAGIVLDEAVELAPEERSFFSASPGAAGLALRLFDALRR